MPVSTLLSPRRRGFLARAVAAGPSIPVPAIPLEGDANGTPHPEPASDAGKSTGRYAHRLVKGAGHNLPQEAAPGLRGCGGRCGGVKGGHHG